MRSGAIILRNRALEGNFGDWAVQLRAFQPSANKSEIAETNRETLYDVRDEYPVIGASFMANENQTHPNLPSPAVEFRKRFAAKNQRNGGMKDVGRNN